jgi:porin
MKRDKINKYKCLQRVCCFFYLLLLLSMAQPVCAQSSGPSSEADQKGFGGPDSTQNRIASDRVRTETILDLGFLKPWYEWKDTLQKEYGLAFGAEYNAVYLKASDSLPGADDDSGGGIFRFRSAWEIFGRGTDHSGTLMFLVEHTHDYTDTLPSAFAGESLGYVGISNLNYNDDGWRLNTLYWDQKFQGGRYEVFAGFLDVSDYVDVYPLTSPWTDFFNYAFSIGAGSLDLPSDGALGLVGGAWLTESVYAMAGLVDQKADATDPFEGFDTFWNDHEFFKHFEIGWTGASQEAWFLNNVHLTLWHADERDEMGVEDGWGGVLSFNHSIGEKWLVFARGGYSDDGGSLLERSVSIGGGYTPGGLQLLGSGSQLGFGANWGRPNEALVGTDLDDQYAMEVYFRWQVADEIAITPSVQLLIDPALNPEEDSVWIFGLRVRVAL